MSRNGLYVLIAVLLVVLIGAGAYIYHEQTKPGLQIQLDNHGVKIQGNG
ncbi:MAG: hypothetical protein ACTHOR_06740 [Devosia sp.]|jgi:hypothetical protein